MRSRSLLFSFLLLPGMLAAQVSKERAATADVAFKAGYAAMQRNDLTTAREKFSAVVKLVPQIEEGHSALGAVLVQLGLYPDAIAELKYALKLKPQDTAAQTNLAVAYAHSNQPQEASALFAGLNHLSSDL